MDRDWEDEVDRELAELDGGAEVRDDQPVAGFNDPASEYWRNEITRQSGPEARARAERAERAEAFHRAERERDVQRQRSERASGDDWRRQPPAKAPDYLDDRGKVEWERENDTREAIRESAGRKQERQDLEGYHRMAAESGTNLPTALGHYTTLEALGRRDQMAALDIIAKNFGVSPQDMAERYGRMSGDPVYALGFSRAGAQASLDQSTYQTAASIDAERQDRANVERALGLLEHSPRMRAAVNAHENRICELFEQGIVKRTSNPAEDLSRAVAIAEFDAEFDRGRAKAHAAAARRSSRQLTGSASGAGDGGSRNRRGSVEDDAAEAWREVHGRL